MLGRIGRRERVVVMDGGSDREFFSPRFTFWDPYYGASDPNSYFLPFRKSPNRRTNLFCSGHVPLADGRIFFAGGQFWEMENPTSLQPATRNIEIFDQAQPQWIQGATPYLHAGRWYPTCVRDGHGNVLIFSGERQYNPRQIEDSVEVYNAASNTIQQLPPGANINVPNPYGFFYLLPGGEIFFAGGPIQTKYLNAARTAWINTGQNTGHPEINYCTSVMYEPGVVLKIGGRPGGPSVDAVSTVSRIDLRSLNPTPQWSNVGNLIRRRANATAVLLPDGNVCVVGGNERVNSSGANIDPLYTAEFFDPFLPTVQSQESPPAPPPAGQPQNAADPRTYHSVALLLSDGTVFVAGGDQINGFGSTQINGRYRSYNILKPPYRDGEIVSFAEPSINGVAPFDEWTLPLSEPATITIGWSGTLPPVGYQLEVVLTAVGSVTHGFDMNQRRIVLQIVAIQGDNTIKVQVPGGRNTVPPGWYMLWVINRGNNPSAGSRAWVCPKAAFIRISWTD